MSIHRHFEGGNLAKSLATPELDLPFGEGGFRGVHSLSMISQSL